MKITSRIYPNPVTAKLGVVFEKFIPVKREIQITDASGKTVLLKSIQAQNDGSVLFDLSKFCNGIYFIKISTGIENRVFKVIKI